MLGSGVGGLLLVMADCYLNVINDTPDYFFEDGSSLLLAATTGSLSGAVIGLAFWVVFTGAVHPLFQAVACGIVTVVLCVPLHFLIWNLGAPAETHGYGDPFHGLEVFYSYFVVTLPASAVLGLVVGWLRGIRGRTSE